MCLRNSLAAAFVFVFSSVVVLSVPPPTQPRFAQTSSDLKADPSLHFGELPNGLKYVVVANKEPKERASLRLLVLAGSLQENEEQRGLAHFLEHLAFNGSTHYPPGTLVEYFQRLGMSFGGDTNAYTSFEHTAYQIELPDTKANTLADGLRVFADFAGGLLLEPKSIDKERGIILSEKRARDSVDFRQFEAEYNFLLGTTRLPKRIPIGLATNIEQAKVPVFADFYNTWYRPERMAVIAVGDFDAATVEKQIAAAFGPITARAPKRADPDLGPVAEFDGLRTNYHAEPEAGATTVAIQTVTPQPGAPDTAQKRLEELPRDLALAMLNRRLAILAKKEGAPFTQGSASINDGYDFFRNGSIELTCKPEQWAAALAVAEQELRRALTYGFEPAELHEAVANALNGLDQAVKTFPTRRSEEVASGLVHALVDGKVFTSPIDDLALFKPALNKLDVEACVLALREVFARPQRYISVMGNARIEGGTTATTAMKALAATAAKSGLPTPEAQIVDVYEKAHAVAVTPSEQLSDSKFAYTDFGAPGKVTEKKYVDDLDLTLITFANGVRLNLKKTDFEAGQIQFSIRVGTGQLTEPKDKPGLAFFADSTFIAGGLGKHSVDELQRVFAGKTVALGFHIGSDALVFSGGTNGEDLALQFQLLAAFMTDPGYRPEALRSAQKSFEHMYSQLEHTPEGPLDLEVPRLLANGDARFGLPAKDVVLARNLDEVRTWLTPQFSSGPIEIAVVGDLDLEKTIEAVAKTFGALPSREPKPSLAAERTVSFPAKPFSKDYSVVTAIPKGVVALYWPTTDGRDIRVVRRLHLLAEVFSDRLRVKIREELGDAYSPEAGSIPSETYLNYGLLYTSLTIDPEKAVKINETVSALADELAKNGVTTDELARAKNPVLTVLRESARTNDYWLSAVLSNAQEFPQRLDWCRTRYADDEGITKADLDTLAKQYLTSKRAFRVVVHPEKK